MIIPQSLFLFILLFAISVFQCHSLEKRVYIVYMGEKHKGEVHKDEASTQSLHHSMLQGILGSAEAAKESMVYSYKKSFNGFAAILSDEEVKKFTDMEEVISVFPNNAVKLQTTRSWDFIGFSKSYAQPSLDGHDVIIGVFDSGIWPESESFNDEELSPPPNKWKGKCMTAHNFTCNHKIIGAQYYNILGTYYNDIKSARDATGHGTHTASIAAGREVVGANYFGLANGTARGGAPNARIAVYKVCWDSTCSPVDILAAFDDAISDGVDVISVSFGGYSNENYLFDPIAIGSFHAMKNGVLTIAAACNYGPDRGQVCNSSPWLVTAAATSIDRKFYSRLVLGNDHLTIFANAINTYNLDKAPYPLIWGGNATNFSANNIPAYSSQCNPGSLNTEKVKGKIVVCEVSSKGSEVQNAGGVGTIFPNQPYENYAKPHPIPVASIDDEGISQVLEYLKSFKNPQASIMFSQAINDTEAPYVASFSGRGPNLVSPDVLKPDLSAPGVNILAAWSPIAPPISVEKKVKESINYNVVSGTSVSCPHVTAAAAHVKTSHPDWSPAAIKSALMTTAYVMDHKKHENENEFAYGSGLVNPVKAVNPGLVFNASEADYVDFLCKQGYTNTTLRLISNDTSFCKRSKLGRAWDLNYPSFAVAVEDGHKIMANFKRTVTNVGLAKSTYEAIIDVPKLLKVSVKPSTLAFSTIGEEKSFVVKVRGPKISQVPIMSGSITWKHEMHEVRTPLIIYTVLPWVFQNNPHYQNWK